MKRKRSVVSILLFLLAFVCLGTGIYFLGSWYLENKADQEKSERNVEKMEQVIQNTPPEATVEPDTVPDGTLGILYIPSFDNFKHVIAYGVDNPTLDTYVGMYKTYSMPGQNGLCVLAAHSTRFAGREKYAFFNRIEDKVKPGDEVRILWKDGNTYEYTVSEIYTWIPKDQQEDYFEKYDDKTKQTLILQTCTHGDGTHRSFIVCDRKDNAQNGNQQKFSIFQRTRTGN